MPTIRTGGHGTLSRGGDHLPVEQSTFSGLLKPTSSLVLPKASSKLNIRHDWLSNRLSRGNSRCIRLAITRLRPRSRASVTRPSGGSECTRKINDDSCNVGWESLFDGDPARRTVGYETIHESSISIRTPALRAFLVNFQRLDYMLREYIPR
jgi:hypothetical protein